MGNAKEKIPLQRVDTNRWRIPKDYNAQMYVPGIVYADDELIAQIQEDNALQQVANVATLPGIVGYSLAMPDIHWGYGFPVGGVAHRVLVDTLPPAGRFRPGDRLGAVLREADRTDELLELALAGTDRVRRPGELDEPDLVPGRRRQDGREHAGRRRLHVLESPLL